MTNKELLQKFWLRQLHVLSVKTLLVRNVSNVFSVVPDSNFYWSAKICACDDNPAERRQLGKLLNANLLTRWHILYLQVYFDTDLAKEAFKFARQFWLNKKVPELRDSNMRMQNGKCLSSSDLHAWRQECYTLLVNKFVL